MKRIIILTIVFMFMAGVAFAKDYVAVTPDSTVTAVEDVQVSATETKQKTDIVSLKDLNNQIANAQERVTFYQSEVTRLQAERALVEVEAKKVKLKVKEVIEK